MGDENLSPHHFLTVKGTTMKRIGTMSIAVAAFAGAIAFLGQGELTKNAAAQARQPREVPRFEVDPSWPKLPAKWVWGQVSSVSVDERDHAWILQRPSSI